MIPYASASKASSFGKPFGELLTNSPDLRRCARTIYCFSPIKYGSNQPVFSPGLLLPIATHESRSFTKRLFVNQIFIGLRSAGFVKSTRVGSIRPAVVAWFASSLVAVRQKDFSIPRILPLEADKEQPSCCHRQMTKWLKPLPYGKIVASCHFSNLFSFDELSLSGRTGYSGIFDRIISSIQ